MIPYIHLALSEGIARGHYGINAAEAASPSSSVLWPYLLSLFAHARWQVTAVLGINLVAGVVAAVLLGALVAKWTRVEGSPAELTRRIPFRDGAGVCREPGGAYVYRDGAHAAGDADDRGVRGG